MKAKFGFQNPEDVQCTMRITMPMHDWKRLKEQLSSSAWPSWKFTRAIGELISKAAEQYSKETDIFEEDE